MSVVPIYKFRTFDLERIVIECFVNQFRMQYGHASAEIVNTRSARLAKQKKSTVEMGLDIDTN